jgi:hypothetical protein
MSENTSGNTGRLPDASIETNVFHNVNLGNNASNSPMNVSVNAPANASAEAAANASANAPANAETALPETAANAANPANENSSPENNSPLRESEYPVANSVSTTKTGKPLSVAQSDLQRLRSETLSDMRKSYAERFGDSSLYPKPPKAKAYHAAGLTTIRKRDGEAAYDRALKDIMDKNDPMLGTNGKSQLTMTRKSKKNPLNASANVTRNAPRNAANIGATNTAISSIEEMGRTAKGLIDTMMQTSKTLARELSKTGNTAALAQVSSMAKTLKYRKQGPRASRKAPLFTVPEEGNNSANATA